MKLNRMICPTCGHETLTDAAYTRCDACGVMFYASQSKGVALPNPYVTTWRINTVWPTIGWPTIGPTFVYPPTNASQ